MTIKNKVEEPKKESAEPAPAPNDDLVTYFFGKTLVQHVPQCL